MWKSQSPWPTFRGALYDSWLGPTGGYWGAKAAWTRGEGCHVLLDRRTQQIVVVHRGEGLHAFVHLHGILHMESFDLTGRSLSSRSVSVNIAPGIATDLGQRFLAPVRNGTTILSLALRGKAGGLMAWNEYWISEGRRYADLGRLREVGRVRIQVQASHTRHGSRRTVDAELHNTDSFIAVAVTIALWSATTGHVEDPRALPAACSEGHFHLLPGEQRSVHCDAEAVADLPGPLILHADGWNVEPVTVEISSKQHRTAATSSSAAAGSLSGKDMTSSVSSSRPGQRPSSEIAETMAAVVAVVSNKSSAKCFSAQMLTMVTHAPSSEKALGQIQVAAYQSALTWQVVVVLTCVVLSVSLVHASCRRGWRRHCCRHRIPYAVLSQHDFSGVTPPSQLGLSAL